MNFHVRAPKPWKGLILVKNSWKEVAPMNEARHDAFGAALNGKIYVAGGLQLQENMRSFKVLESCEVYNH